jgi:5'(3')-deoxyribonucleotidase
MERFELLDITFDCDGPLANTQQEVLNRYNKEYGLNYKMEDIVCWDLTKIQKPGTDMCKYFTQPGFFRHLTPVKNAQKVVSMLLAQGHEVFVATASPVEGMSDKVLWLGEHYPVIPRKNISLIERKDKLTGKIILDDGLHNLKPCNFEYPIVYDAPWNRDGAEGLVRVYDWFDFYEVVQKISRGYTYEQLLMERENMKREVI